MSGGAVVMSYLSKRFIPGSERRHVTDKSIEKPTSTQDLVSSDDKTTIANAVVAKIAGIAVREVSGVHALGSSASRAVGALRERIPGSNTNHAQGVLVEVGEKQTAIDVQLIAEYGVSLADLAVGVRRNVIDSIERMTGLQVTEVNIEVQDVHIQSTDQGDDDQGSTPRVQ